MTSYTPGQVSAALFASNKQNVISKNSALAKLFSSKAQTTSGPIAQAKKHTPLSQNHDSPAPHDTKSGSPPPTRPDLKTRKKFKKTHGASGERHAKSTTEGEKIAAVTNPFPYTHETLSQQQPKDDSQVKLVKRKLEKAKDDDDETAGKRPRRDRIRDKEADKRTVFIGNCPLTADKKKLKKLFREFGEIETVRFRCAPPAEPDLPKRAIVITKNFHEQCNNFVSYVVFKEEEAAKKALTRNGFVMDGLHLRVDIAAMAKRHDKKRSVFVGNLPFTIGEEAIRSHFSDCGEVTNVRIVRDRTTSLGKGICYVQFEMKDSVGLALKLNKSELEGRQIRVMVCVNKLKKKEDTSATRHKNSDKSGKPRTKKMTFAPSNLTGSKFQTLLKTKKDKRFRKVKKKKQHAKKDDGLSSVFGTMLSTNKQAAFRQKKADGKRKGKFSHKSAGAKRKPHQKGGSFKGKRRGQKKH